MTKPDPTWSGIEFTMVLSYTIYLKYFVPVLYGMVPKK